MRKFLLAGLLVLVGGCEIHGTIKPKPVGVTISTPVPAVGVYVEYEDYCAGSCCTSYQHYDAGQFWQVCETTECYSQLTGNYEFATQDCWYE
jgi:hypothetical protein